MVERVEHNLKDIAKRRSSGETMESIATSKGITQGSLSLWIKRECNRKGLIKKVTTKIEYLPIKDT